MAKKNSKRPRKSCRDIAPRVKHVEDGTRPTIEALLAGVTKDSGPRTGLREETAIGRFAVEVDRLVSDGLAMLGAFVNDVDQVRATHAVFRARAAAVLLVATIDDVVAFKNAAVPAKQRRVLEVSIKRVHSVMKEQLVLEMLEYMDGTGIDPKKFLATFGLGGGGGKRG